MSAVEWILLGAVLVALAIFGWVVLKVTDPGLPTASERARERAKRHLALRREHCYCAPYRKPCPSCQDYESGLLDMVEWVEFNDPEASS